MIHVQFCNKHFLFRLKEIFVLVVVIISFISDRVGSLLRDEKKSLAASAFSLPCKTYTGYYIPFTGARAINESNAAGQGFIV